jgi:hypothetical protein
VRLQAVGRHLPAFFAAGALCLLAAILVLTITKPRRVDIGAPTPAPAR